MDHPERKSTSKPQLRRFIHHDKPIKRLGFLGAGAESCVYHIECEGKSYALKLARHWPYYDTDFPNRIKAHERILMAPFVHEARAFARLDSVDENGTWAVKCHGWIKLNDSQFKELGNKHQIFCRWAIIKDMIPDEISMSDIPEVRRKMQIARKALLWPGDVKPENYRGSFIVDLGNTITYPEIRRSGRIQDAGRYLLFFNDMHKKNVAAAKKLEEWLKKKQDEQENQEEPFIRGDGTNRWLNPEKEV
ncbi:conserved hypothetical protein [Histoplasma capsulatum H143]|uniref:Protein kinase domain-containing protein n=1 Tax=Ajellomyces capsulatus (strain H143) TaxID=544712 RepID=C6H2P9_AJECH|nr:conserved hypothetical protein [Histoplasma capsulatum H143]